MAVQPPAQAPFILPQDWLNMNMEDPAPFNDHRPYSLQVYYPDLHDIPNTNSLLLRSAVMTVVEGDPEGDFGHRIMAALANRHGGRLNQFSLRQLDDEHYEFLLICQNVRLRNEVTSTPLLRVGDLLLRFNDWHRGHGCAEEPPTFWSRIRITGVPLHLYNPQGVQFLVSGFGTPIRVAPHFSQGRFIDLRMLVKGCHPAFIPHLICVAQDPFAKFAEVHLEGFIQVFPFNDHPPYFGPGRPWFPPPDNADDGSSSGKQPSSCLDYATSPMIEQLNQDNE